VSNNNSNVQVHILHVIVSMDPVVGGPCQGIRNLDQAMQDKGIVREVVCLDAPDAAFLGKDSFKIHAIGPPHGPWRYSPRLKEWLRANVGRFDVIIINGLWIYHSYAAWKVIKNLKAKNLIKKVPRVLVMPHGMLDPYFQRAKERWHKAIRNWLYWKLIESKVVNDADGLLFTCQTELLLARETFRPYHPKKEYNAGYGIKQPPHFKPEMADAFYKQCLNVKGKQFLLYLSRIHPKKGVDMLLRSYIKLYEVRKDIPSLVIAGPGWDSLYGQKLKEYLTSKTAPVFPVDMLSDDSKWGAFYECEAFILPSHQENFGIALVEALACGKPGLISNQVNIWVEVQSEGGGIVECDTDKGTYQLLEKWVNLTIEEKVLMGQRAKNTYENHFTVDTIVENYLAAFAEQL